MHDQPSGNIRIRVASSLEPLFAVPPRVPAWTSELAYSGLKRMLKQPLLSLRGYVYGFFVRPSAPPPELKQCRKIAVLRTDRLGDAILTFPLVRALATSAPWAEFVYAVRDSWSELFRDQSNDIGVLALPERFSEQARLLREIDVDLILDPLTDPTMATARLSHRSGAKWCVGFSGYGREYYFTSYLEPPSDQRHFCDETFQLLNFWKASSLPRTDPPFLQVPGAVRAWWKQYLKRAPVLSDGYVCIHPGAFYPTQRWPLGRFRQLAERIQKELGRTVAWCGDFTNKTTTGASESPTDPTRLVSFDHLTIGELAAVAGHAQLFIGNNSGPLHLACALGTRTISTMGPSVPHRWWPLGESHKVVRLGVECSPCRLGRCSHHTCLKAIHVDHMFDLVRQHLSE